MIAERFARIGCGMRLLSVAFAMGLVLLPGAVAEGQSASATLSGTVVDKTGAVLPAARIEVVNADTAAVRVALAGSDGGFVVTTLPPGRYVLRATLKGFVTTEMPDIRLSVNDRISVNVEMAVAGQGEDVVVVGEASRVRTSPSVGTVVDRRFVENLPLNGRSLQALMELTPGVVLAPAGGANAGGQFSVNGQRTNANSFIVDGVSVNVGMANSTGTQQAQSSSGQLPALTTLGTTSGLVSADALEEFRIETSSYAAEFGRTPGGQVSMVTRSGTNAFHGSASEYFRDDALDAHDWFLNNSGQPKAKLSQHNFGAVLGGPVLRNRTFFFASYEGLRLDRPRAATVFVPTVAVRQSVSPQARLLLNALPIPNGAPSPTQSTHAAFNASFSDRSELDATSLRLDHRLRERVTFFARVNHAPSYTQARSGTFSYTTKSAQKNISATAGSTWILSNRMVHDLRFNYTRNEAPTSMHPDDFGGSTVPGFDLLPFGVGQTPENAQFGFAVTGGGSWFVGNGALSYIQRQFNLVDSLTVALSRHELKFGADIRRISPLMGGETVGGQSLTFNIAGIQAGRATAWNSALYGNGSSQAVVFDAVSLYAQDNWKVANRLTLNYGLRWEFIPPPHATDPENDAVTLENIDNPYGGQVRLAPPNTPLWKTRYNTFAPRMGASYLLTEEAGSQLVIRGGFGLFYDLGYGHVGNAFSSATYPFALRKGVTMPDFPLTPATLAPAQPGDAPSQIWMLDRNLRLPRTYQWNVSAERALGLRQAVSVAYVGAAGRELLKRDLYNIQLVEWPGRQVSVFMNRNNAYSNYHSLQLQYQRRMSSGIQAMVSYTLSQSKDTTSDDLAGTPASEVLQTAADYGYSSFDVRHGITAAVTYQIPEPSGPEIWRHIGRDWGLDMILRSRSAFPITVSSAVLFPPATELQPVRPNVVPGQPFWIEDAAKPGGRYLNINAFTVPSQGMQGNLQRGAVRGFSARQVDMALRREFALTSRLRTQLRFEVFNVLNTPLFADPTGSLTSASFGVSTGTLGQQLGGLNQLYQIGGARSVQLAAKLLF